MFESLKAVSAVQKLKKGGTADLSKSQITSIIVNLQDASRNLPRSRFSDFNNIFQNLKRDKQKINMDWDKYIETCNQIMDELGKVAPYEFYDGEMSLEISKENSITRAKRLELFDTNHSLEQLDEVLMDAKMEMFDFNKMSDKLRAQNIENYNRLANIVTVTENKIADLEIIRRNLMDEI